MYDALLRTPLDIQIFPAHIFALEWLFPPNRPGWYAIAEHENPGMAVLSCIRHLHLDDLVFQRDLLAIKVKMELELALNEEKNCCKPGFLLLLSQHVALVSRWSDFRPLPWTCCCVRFSERLTDSIPRSATNQLSLNGNSLSLLGTTVYDHLIHCHAYSTADRQSRPTSLFY